MSTDVVCLRPEGDFTRVGVRPPAAFNISYRKPDDADVPMLLRSASALVIPAVGSKLPGTLFDATALKLVQVTGAGLDRLDEAVLKSHKIAVANVPGGSNSAVAEYVVTTASVLLRRFAWADGEIRAGNYAAFRGRLLADNLAGLDGLTVGIVGMGIIGRAVAEAFHRMGCRLVYHDPAPGSVEHGQRLEARALSLEELLRTADVVTLHVPLLPATANLIGTRELAWMKAGAILIQASRGGIVDEAALAAALTAGHLGGAAVDVYSTEPPPPDHPLLKLTGDGARRLLLTPHIAGVTRQSSAFLFQSAWDNVERVLLRGEAPRHRVY